MKILIIKLGAAGDVLRTTPILNVLTGDIVWITSSDNRVLLGGNERINRCISWEDVEGLATLEYDLVINLEDSITVGQFVQRLKYKYIFGAYLNKSNVLVYTDTSQEWFDLSLISRFGKEKADELKLQNRKSYQDMLFRGLGFEFKDEPYYLPLVRSSELIGDIAIADKAGSVWPMKNWAFYSELMTKLQTAGYKVNMLPQRATILEHVADVQSHKYLISGDSLPMHIALGSGMKCVTIFQCTSPWEIYDYGLQTKITSPLLERYFYKRTFDQEATTCISVEHVCTAVMSTFGI